MLVIKLFSCRAELKFSFFALLAFCNLFAGFSGGVFLFAAVFLHELSHLALLILFRAPPEKLEVSALGCRIVRSPQSKLTYLQKAAVSLAGPLGNLIYFVVMLLFGFKEHFFTVSCLSLGIFHLLPVEPLDGGLALHYLLCNCFTCERARKISIIVSVIFIIPIAIAGFCILFRTRYNFSLLAVSLYLIFYLVSEMDDLS